MKHLFGEQMEPGNEKERLAKLYTTGNQYEQTGPFKHIARMAGHIFKVPLAIVHLHPSAAKTSVGITDPLEGSGDIGLYSLAILQEDTPVLERAALRDLYRLDSSAIFSYFDFKFWVSAPLKTAAGFIIGIIAIGDKQPRVFSNDDEQLLQGLAAVVVEELEEFQLAVSVV